MSAQAEWRRLNRFEKRELPITIFSPRAPVSDTKTD